MNWIEYVQTPRYLAMVQYVRSEMKDDSRVLILADYIQDGGFDHYAEQIRQLHSCRERNLTYERISRFLMREYVLPLTPNIEGSCKLRYGFVETVYHDFDVFLTESQVSKWSVWEAIRYTQPFAKCIIDPLAYVSEVGYSGYARDISNRGEASIFLSSITGGRIVSPKLTANGGSYFDPVRVLEDSINFYLDGLYGIK